MRSLVSRFAIRSRSSSATAKNAFSTTVDQAGAIDVHTHMYLPKYMDILRKRTDVPYVRDVNNESRLVILPGEDKEESTSIGRPIGKSN